MYLGHFQFFEMLYHHIFGAVWGNAPRKQGTQMYRATVENIVIAISEQKNLINEIETYWRGKSKKPCPSFRICFSTAHEMICSDMPFRLYFKKLSMTDFFSKRKSKSNCKQNHTVGKGKYGQILRITWQKGVRCRGWGMSVGVEALMFVLKKYMSIQDWKTLKTMTVFNIFPSGGKLGDCPKKLCTRNCTALMVVVAFSPFHRSPATSSKGTEFKVIHLPLEPIGQAALSDDETYKHAGQKKQMDGAKKTIGRGNWTL